MLSPSVNPRVPNRPICPRAQRKISSSGERPGTEAPWGSTQANYLHVMALGGCWGHCPAPPPPQQWRLQEKAHTLGLGSGGKRDVSGQERREPTHSSEKHCRADLFLPKMVTDLCMSGFWEKEAILMARDMDFEPRIAFRLWFGYTNSGNSNILNKFISFCALLILNLLSCCSSSRALCARKAICPSPALQTGPSLPLQSSVQTGFSKNCQLSLCKIIA